MNKEELKEMRKQMLPLVTTFSPRDSLSKLSSPLGLAKEFAQMEQKLHDSWSSDEDSLFSYHPSEEHIVLFNNKVKCRKIEEMLPKLQKMVEGEMHQI